MTSTPTEGSEQPVEAAYKKTSWVSLFSFKGRINRAGYWWLQLVGLSGILVSQFYSALLFVFLLVWIPIFLTVTVRRLHDLNRSSWWLLLFVGAPGATTTAIDLVGSSSLRLAIALVSVILETWCILDLGFRPGEVGPNRYGADPLQVARENNQSAYLPSTHWLRYAVITVIVGALISGATFSRLFYITSGSQLPVLFDGDRVLFWNFERGYPRSIRRGDLVAYRLPRERGTIFTGRVVGVPGDRIRISDGVIHLNDEDVPRVRMPDFVTDSACSSVDLAAPVNVPQWREQLPNGSAYNTIECLNSPLPTQTPLYSVPVDHLFILSHNRRNAIDSRSAQIGYVPVENIVGRANVVLASMANRIPLWHFWTWGSSFRWRRTFFLVN